MSGFLISLLPVAWLVLMFAAYHLREHFLARHERFWDACDETRPNADESARTVREVREAASGQGG